LKRMTSVKTPMMTRPQMGGAMAKDNRKKNKRMMTVRSDNV
jgi:hypothetical protein